MDERKIKEKKQKQRILSTAPLVLKPSIGLT